MRFRPVLALLSTATAASAAHLVAVRAVPGAGATVVQLDADAPPSFTTLKLASPPRVVIDLAETSAAGVAPEQEVGDAAVRRIAVADAGAHTTRVVIELAQDAEFDVRASQSRVEVRIPRPVVVAEAATAQPAEDAGAAGVAEKGAAKADDSTASLEQGAEPKRSAEDAERAALPTVAIVGTPVPSGATSAAAGRDRGPVPPSAAPVRSLAARAQGSTARVHSIGFRPDGGGQVIVRSDRPVEYEVTSEETHVLIHLRSARIPLQNNRRPLDTRYFEGPIQRVVPLEVPSGTDIRIELRQRAEVHLEQSGPLLTVSFTPRG